MTAESTVQFQGATPYLYYEDAGAALDWLSRVLGFEERARFVDVNGMVQQAEMWVGDQELWFSGHGPGYWDSKGSRPDLLTLVFVSDVDAHYARAVAAGIEVEPPVDKDYGVRTYSVTDPEGYQWGLMQRLDAGYHQTVALEDGGLEEILPPK